MKRNILFLFMFISLYFLTGDAWAQAAGSGEIFSGLAGRAQTIGSGLINVGYIIAGLGLIVFSFMAIFNKISWKNLAYIMFCTFILSMVASVISFVVSDAPSGVASPASRNDSSNVGTATETPPAVSK